jgi:hypothetical protein
MSPEQCAKMMVLPSVAALLMIASTMPLAPGLSPGLPPLRIAALDHPPKRFLR